MSMQDQMAGFYYIGSEKGNITKLVNMYKRGYASAHLQQAMTELTREDRLIPELICCESRYGFAAISHWAEKISKQEDFSETPFIIVGSAISPAEKEHFVNSRFVDDVLDFSDWDESCLHSKIRFLRKFKNSARVPGKESLRPPFTDALHAMLKRGFDILVSLSILILLSPFMLIIALAIRMESRGSILYISKRAGKGYRIFNFYKFRTMVTGADTRRNEFAHLNQYQNTGSVRFFKIENDPRITRIGRFLRNSSLDELPQLLNVLWGDMSLVGNRPLPLYEAETLTTDLHAKRFLAPAGITGLWQIKKRGHSAMSPDERIMLDIDYADKSSLFFDMWIMANTPQALLQKANT